MSASSPQLPLPRPRSEAMSANAVAAWRALLQDFFILGKPRITLLVMLTSAAAAWVGATGPIHLLYILQLALGTGVVAAGTAALNQRWEVKTDALMRRTAVRPLPDGRLRPAQATVYGLALLAFGTAYLWFLINPLCAWLGLATSGTYLLLYTPLKRISPISTLVGAFPGASPILMGWAAARGSLDWAGWALFAIQFLWQFPHFLAIAWLYRDEYARAGICMLPVVDRQGDETGTQMVLYALALLPVSLLPSLMGLTGTLYSVGALLLGLWMLDASWRAKRVLNRATCRRVLLVSISYLPLVFALMVVDHLLLR